MKYRFETKKRDYSDLASGRVLYNAPNTTAFPVRLASEIVQRAFDILQKQRAPGPYRIYDPCCGGGYLLTTIGFLFPDQISELIATELDEVVLSTARQNLALLSPEGLEKRKQEIEGYIKEYGKQSHKDALTSVKHLQSLLGTHEIEIRCQKRDITDLSPFPISDVDIIITDIPYGNIASWAGISQDPLPSLFENCYRALNKSRSLLAITADKHTTLKHESFKRIQHFKLGKRQIALFQPTSTS